MTQNRKKGIFNFKTAKWKLLCCTALLTSNLIATESYADTLLLTQNTTITSPAQVNFDLFDFQNSNSILEINSTDSNVITLNNIFMNAQSSALQISTDTIITDSSASIIGNINIGYKLPAEGATGMQPATLIMKPNDLLALPNISFGHFDSMLELDNSNVNDENMAIFYLNGENFGGKIGSEDIDLAGIVRLTANTQELILDYGTLGTDETKRLKELQIVGDAKVTINSNVFAGSLYFDTSAGTNFLMPVNLGKNSTITLAQDLKLYKEDAILPSGDANHFVADSPTINLGQNALSLNQGTVQFTGTPTINITFDSTTNKMGHIIVKNEEQNAESSAILDLSDVDAINIILEANSELPAENTQYKYPVFISSNGGAINIDHSKVNFMSNEQNKYLTWSYSGSDLPTDIAQDAGQSVGVIFATVDASALPVSLSSSGASSSAVIIAKALSDNVAQGNKDAIILVRNLGEMSSQQETLAIEQIVPNSTGAVALMEANDLNDRAATDRILDNVLNNGLSINFASVDKLDGHYGMAAGDELANKHGVWVSPFYQQAEQKASGKNSSYKVRNYGSTIGIDTMVNDNVTIGLAWTYLKSELKNQGIAGTDKGVTDTNIASFYSLTNLANNYFISGVFAAGLSKVDSREQRSVSSAQTQTAESKYDSQVYTAKVLVGKQQKIGNDFTIIPLVGLRYTQSNDDAYQETGASIQNLAVGKKSNNMTELIIGSKLDKLYITEGKWQIKPELSAFTYLNLKEKAATVKISNDAFSSPVELKGTKASKAWYSLGAAVHATKNLMEYNLSYELQLDKKYIGHQAMLKLRVNF